MTDAMPSKRYYFHGDYIESDDPLAPGVFCSLCDAYATKEHVLKDAGLSGHNEAAGRARLKEQLRYLKPDQMTAPGGAPYRRPKNPPNVFMNDPE